MTKCRSKVKDPWSSSITSANAMLTLDINSRAVLIVRLICHDEKVYEENIFCTTSQHKSQLHFPSQNTRTCTKLTYKQQSTLIKPMGFFPSFSFQFYYDQTTSTKVTSMLPEIAPEMRPSMKKNIWGVSLNFRRSLRVVFTFYSLRWGSKNESSEIQAKEGSN